MPLYRSWCVTVTQCVSCGLLDQGHGGSDTKCPLTVKILDAVKGTAAGPMALALYKKTADGGWTQIANGYGLKRPAFAAESV